MWLRTVCTLTTQRGGDRRVGQAVGEQRRAPRARARSARRARRCRRRCSRGSSRASISGEITASPAAAARTAEVTSSRLRVLETKPGGAGLDRRDQDVVGGARGEHHDRRPRPDRQQLADRRDPVAVRAAGGRAAPRRGRWSRAAGAAWASVPAVPTTSRSGWSSRTSARLALSTSWSSTISTRTGRSSGDPGASGRSGGVSMVAASSRRRLHWPGQRQHARTSSAVALDVPGRHPRPSRPAPPPT